MKFYKVLHKDNTHYGFKYKTGLNIDTAPFNPSGQCEKGGLYFSREDILAFVGSRSEEYIAEVIIPEGAQVYEEPICGAWTFPVKKWKADKIILKRRKRITPAVIEKLIKEGANIDSGFGCWALAAYNGQTEIVKILLKNKNSCASKCLFNACESKRPDMVRLFLENGTDFSRAYKVRFLFEPQIQKVLEDAEAARSK